MVNSKSTNVRKSWMIPNYTTKPTKIKQMKNVQPIMRKNAQNEGIGVEQEQLLKANAIITGRECTGTHLQTIYV